MGYKIVTKRGFDFYVVTSAMQKAVRRNKPDLAGFFALELYHSGYHDYVWKRLLVISAEDCAGLITQEIRALHESWIFVNKKTNDKDMPKCRIFVSKAVLLLCDAIKNRDADHLQCLVYDRTAIEPGRLEKFIEECDIKKEIPDYAYDVHTMEGKRAGKTKEQFFREEMNSLEPRQLGLFDGLVV